MSRIEQNLNRIRLALRPGVELVAVSKTYPPESIHEAYDAGQRIFGENKVQEMAEKHPLCPSDIQWHLIGHLQTNKVKYIAPFVKLIHSVDSLKLLMEIDKRASQNNRVIDCLLQIHIASEETKFGLCKDEAYDLLNSLEFCSMSNVRICGLMGMATLTDNRDLVQSEFRSLRLLFQSLQRDFFPNQPFFKELSMGMSNDFDLAMDEGATLVRIGTSIFGAR
jgi:PLP dependent protein